jgi:hypothetical protein
LSLKDFVKFELTLRAVRLISLKATQSKS